MAKITWRGVNIAGAEGGKKQKDDLYPGVINKDYTWPKEKDIKPWLDKKASIIRYCIAWERVQPELNGPLSADATKPLDAAVKLVVDTGAMINIDIHNYAERTQKDGVKLKIGATNTLTIDHYADFVGKLADRYKGNPLVSIGLMNEPHGLNWQDGSSDAVGLKKMYQAGIDAARKAGFKGWLTYCPADWAKVAQLDKEMGTVLATLNDPENKIIMEVHQYVDNGEQGDDASIIDNDPKIYEKKLAKGTDWAKKFKRPIFLGEYGIPQTDLGVTVEENLIKYLADNEWWGFTQWSAGPWWGSKYFFNLNDVDGKARNTVPPMKLGTDFPSDGPPPPDPKPEPPKPVSDLDKRVDKLEDQVAKLEKSVVDLDGRLDKIADGAAG